MKDIAPELLEKIKKDFEKKLKKSETIKAFREKVKKKTATYKMRMILRSKQGNY